MSKDKTDRFDSTLTNLSDEKTAGFTLGKNAREAMNAWIQRNRANKATLGGQISLGGVRLMKNENETYLRHLRRGVLLAYLTIGGGNEVGIKTLKTQTKNENKATLRRLRPQSPARSGIGWRSWADPTRPRSGPEDLGVGE